MTKGRKARAATGRNFPHLSFVIRHSSFLPSLGIWLLRALELTLRWEVAPAVRAQIRWLREHPDERFIAAMWHNRILVMPFTWERFWSRHRPRPFVLTSLSGDGELLARFAAGFGIGAVRGSARRRGAGALRELVETVKNGHDIFITPDGSRGPRYGLKAGLVSLAQLTGALVIPVGVEFSRCWRLRSWDGFMIPKPFARVTLRIGEPFRVPETQTEADFENERCRCEQALLALTGER